MRIIEKNARRAGAAVVVALALVSAVTASAQMLYAPASLQSYFRVDWQAVNGRKGPAIEGYVYNISNRSANRINLQIERVDAAGGVVGTSTVWVPGDVAMGDRAYFSTPVSAAASYRVQVLSFDLPCQGGGGGGM